MSLIKPVAEVALIVVLAVLVGAIAFGLAVGPFGLSGDAGLFIGTLALFGALDPIKSIASGLFSPENRTALLVIAAFVAMLVMLWLALQARLISIPL